MAKKVEITLDIKGNVEATAANLRALQQQLKKTAAGTEEFKDLVGTIDDLQDKLKGAKAGASDWIDSLESAGGPLGMLGKGINSVKVATQSFGAAWKAIGIGALVSLISGLVAAFSKQEGAMKKLEPIMIAFERILGGVFKVMEPLIDAFLDLALQALPYVEKGIKVVYSSLATLFTSIGKIGSALVKLFKGDFAGAWEDAKSSVMDFGKEYNKNVKKFEEGSNQMTATEKKNQEELDKERKEKEQKAAERRKAALEAQKKDLDAQIALEINKETTSKKELERLLEARLQNQIKSEKLSANEIEVIRQENRKKVEEALKADADTKQKAFQDEYKKRQDNSKLEIDELNAKYNKFKALYGENSAEARKAQDEVFQGQLKALEDEKKFLLAKEGLTEEEKNRIRAIGIEQQNLTAVIISENQKRLQSDNEKFLKEQEDLKKNADTAFQNRMKLAQGDLELQQKILSDKIAADEAYYTKLLEVEGLTAEQRKKIQDDQTANAAANAEAQVEIKKKQVDAELMLLDAIAQGTMALADIVGKNTAAGKALAVAGSLISTYSAIAKQLAAFAGVPVPGYAIAQAVVTGLVGFKAVADIIKTPIPTDNAKGGTMPGSQTPRALASGGYVSGPGTGTSDSIPALLSNGESVINAKATQMFRPLLSTINQIGGGRKFASGGVIEGQFSANAAMTQLNSALAQTQNQPIKTYVVSSDMSSQQMLDRAIKDRSTL
jgi:hypothetical protein